MKDNIKIINTAQITDAVAELCIEANIYAGNDIRRALKAAREGGAQTRLELSALDVLLENIDIAERERLPICQDTGMAVVFADIGTNVHVDGNIEDAINAGVSRGYRNGHLRSSVVSDPIGRVNTGNNTPAVIHYNFVPGDTIRLTVAPKGFGSENMSAVKMLSPSDGLAGVIEFTIQTVKQAGANPCPPVIVGVGVGGTMEKAALLSKRALLRDIGSVNTDPTWAQVENRLLSLINELGIGVSGYGGGCTALGVHIETFPTHIAGLPVAVNIGCHATRHKSAELGMEISDELFSGGEGA